MKISNGSYFIKKKITCLASHYFERKVKNKSNSILSPRNFNQLVTTLPKSSLPKTLCDQYHQHKKELESQHQIMKNKRYRSVYRFYKNKYLHLWKFQIDPFIFFFQIWSYRLRCKAKCRYAYDKRKQRKLIVFRR